MTKAHTLNETISSPFSEWLFHFMWISSVRPEEQETIKFGFNISNPVWTLWINSQQTTMLLHREKGLIKIQRKIQSLKKILRKTVKCVYKLSFFFHNNNSEESWHFKFLITDVKEIVHNFPLSSSLHLIKPFDNTELKLVPAEDFMIKASHWMRSKITKI